MGRMADARKRAKRGASAASPEPPAAEVSFAPARPEAPASVAPEAKAAPEAKVAPTEATPASPATQLTDFVFPSESPDEPGPAGARLTLPSSGLAEEVLSRVHVEVPGTPVSARIELPASGLAEDILSRHEAASVPAASQAERPAAPAEPAPPAATAGAHSLSFFAAPAQEQRVAAEATEHLATFYLDREEYGVDVKQVQEIRRVTEITAVPRAPEFMRGVINLRGRILPVMDLRCKLGLGEVGATPNTRIIVVRVRERLLGLLVDGASQVLKVPLSRIEPPPEEVVERGGDYIRGVAKLDDRLIILMDIERLLAHELRAANLAQGAERPATGSGS
jgi:purine-binding chemotaxis protein CheW